MRWKKQVEGGRVGEVVKRGRERERQIEEKGHMLWYIGLLKMDKNNSTGQCNPALAEKICNGDIKTLTNTIPDAWLTARGTGLL